VIEELAPYLELDPPTAPTVPCTLRGTPKLQRSHPIDNLPHRFMGVVVELLPDVWRVLWWLLTEFYKVVVEVVALIIVWILLKYERKRLQGFLSELRERIDTLGQQIKAVQVVVEQAPEQTDDGAGKWERVRSRWQEIRDRIELHIRRIPNANVRRKYSNFARHSYQHVISELLRDDWISATTGANLLNMNSAFLRYRLRPAKITSDEAREFERWSDSVDELPSPPRAEIAGPPPANSS